MKKRYKHLDLEEREKLFVFRQMGLSLREIAKRLNRSDTTLGRELKRNKTGVGKHSREYLVFKYVPCRAQKKSEKRALKQRSKAPLKEPLIFLYVREHLRAPYLWTPEIIAGRLRRDFPTKKITKETIYRYVYARKNRRYKMWQYLTLGRKKRMVTFGRKVRHNGKIPNATSIDLRPPEVNLRTSVGHWETDNMVGKQVDKTALSVTVERLSRLTLMSLTNRTAAGKTEVVINRLKMFPKTVRQTLTADNGKEMTNHEVISHSLRISTYFCHAYHSWEKGTVENTNGRIRRFIPKGVSLDDYTKEEIRAYEYHLNSTPRKCLDYLTPYEKMREVLTNNCCTSG